MIKFRIKKIAFFAFKSILFVIIFSFQFAVAGDQDTALDPSSTAALSQTQSLLNNPNQRQQNINKNGGDAKKADDFVKQLTGSAPVSNDIYALAAEVFGAVVQNCHGDPVKMAAALQEFQKNPEAFAASWTPEQKKKLHDLSLRVPTSINKQ